MTYGDTTEHFILDTDKYWLYVNTHHAWERGREAHKPWPQDVARGTPQDIPT
jgi:hypothetical protein